MHAIVIYETLWGNTEKIARAIAKGLETAMTVDVVDTDSAPTALDAYDLVVVGGPTHAFSMSRPSTRKGAVETNGAPAAPHRGLREWLADLEPHSRSIRAVAFDTRVDSPRLPGSAAKAARHELRSLGFDVTIKAESFRVHGYEGPLLANELERAEHWAKRLIPVTMAGSGREAHEGHHDV